MFAGEGTSRNDVAAWVDVLQREDLEYALVSSSRLDALATDGLTSRRLLLIAGGNFEEMGAGLDPSTPGKVRSAVRGGLGYVGVCAERSSPGTARKA